MVHEIRFVYQIQGGIERMETTNALIDLDQQSSEVETKAQNETNKQEKINSDLAAFLISPVRQRFEDNIKPMLSRNFGMGSDELKQLKPDNRGEQDL